MNLEQSKIERHSCVAHPRYHGGQRVGKQEDCYDCMEYIKENTKENKIQQIKIESERQFAKYGFEKPDFEVELLKKVKGKILGIVYSSSENGLIEPIAFWWDADTGKINKDYTNMYNLTPLPKLEVDTKVLVWDEGFYKTKALFSHFDSKNKICVFPLGRTSWSNDSNTQSWTYWELTKD